MTQKPQQTIPVQESRYTPEPLAITPEKACRDVTLITQKAVTKGLKGSKHPHTQKLLSITRAQKALMDTQIHLNNFLCSLVSSVNSAENSMEETPLKQLFQEIHKRISILWIQGARFDFIRHEAKSPCTDFLFNELTAYWEHSKDVYLHNSGSYSEISGHTSIPLIFQEDTVGFFSFPREKNPNLSNIKTIETMVTSIMNLVQVLIIFLKTSDRAGEDPLTGIPNRRAILEKTNTLFHMAVRQNTYVSFFMIDLDHFKNINDSYWHSIGDRVLVAVSKALWGGLRPEDVIGRYGGEEFVAVIYHDEEWGCITIAERLLEVVKSVHIPTGVGESIVQPTCSIWISTMKPSSDMDPSVFIHLLLSKADNALYQAKDGGRNQFVHSSSSVQTLAPSPQTTESNTPLSPQEPVQ